MRQICLVVALVFVACAPEDEPPDEGSLALTAGDGEAQGMLAVANQATYDDLVDADRVDMSPRSARNIVASRPFATLAELDATYWVGQVALSRLLHFAEAEGLVGPGACTAGAPRPKPQGLLVTPDDGLPPVLALLDGARHSIDIVIYILDNDAVEDSLVAAAARGVEVRVILDRERWNAEEKMAELIAEGIDARLSQDRFVYTHQKTVVVDHRVALVFSGNLDEYSFGDERNFGVVTRDWQDIEDLSQVFAADWGTAPADASCTRLVISPDNASDRVIEVVRGATRTLEVEALYVTDSRIMAELIAAHDRGVTVRVLLNDPSFGFSDPAYGRRLREAGIDCRHTDDFFIHAKVIVADGARVLVGSQNFSYNSLERNREVGVVVDAPGFPVERVRAVFEGDFAAGVAF